MTARLTKAAAAVIAERERQKTVEGWTEEHDDEHRGAQMAAAASCYAFVASLGDKSYEYLRGNDHEGYPMWKSYPVLRDVWPWRDEWWKPKNRRSDLVRAGALILAEIERLDRADEAARAARRRPK